MEDNRKFCGQNLQNVFEDALLLGYITQVVIKGCQTYGQAIKYNSKIEYMIYENRICQ